MTTMSSSFRLEVRLPVGHPYGHSWTPFSGGTSVSSALTCPIHERRTVVSMDLCKMNRLLWIDRNNMLARAEAGVIGIDLEQQV